MEEACHEGDHDAAGFVLEDTSRTWVRGSLNRHAIHSDRATETRRNGDL